MSKKQKPARPPTLRGLEEFASNLAMQNLSPTARENLAELAGKGGSQQGLLLALLVNQHDNQTP
jgi:hypothetical protein